MCYLWRNDDASNFIVMHYTNAMYYYYYVSGRAEKTPFIGGLSTVRAEGANGSGGERVWSVDKCGAILFPMMVISIL